ncbi:MAG: PPOX class F420-dependent oxidoreductase [Chloroflexota bacterium]
MKLTDLNNPRYISLETFRKNGTGVKTPVWTVEKEGELYVWTDADSWKAKRIRNNANVRVAPSDFSGNVKGDWVDGVAQVTTAEEDAALEKNMRGWIMSKYNIEYISFRLITSITGLFGKGPGARCVIKISDRDEQQVGDVEESVV